MASAFTLAVVAPDKAVVETTATSVVIPGSEGYFGVMAGHVPVIAALKPGLLEFTDENGQRNTVYVGGGFAEIQGSKVMILADEASLAKDIDLSRAEEDLESARRALRGENSTSGSEEAIQEIEKAMQRIRAARAAR